MLLLSRLVQTALMSCRFSSTLSRLLIFLIGNGDVALDDVGDVARDDAWDDVVVVAFDDVVFCSCGFHQSLLFLLVLHVRLRDPVPLLFAFVGHFVSVALVPFSCHVFVVLGPGCVVSC
jgi:hypothetical protein